MKSPEQDEHGYPTEKTLDAIKEWPGSDFAGLIDFVGRAWQWEDRWHFDGKELCAITGGWSGNESLIGALQQNVLFWMMCWWASYRGGKFEFKLPEGGDSK